MLCGETGNVSVSGGMSFKLGDLQDLSVSIPLYRLYFGRITADFRFVTVADSDNSFQKPVDMPLEQSLYTGNILREIL